MIAAPLNVVKAADDPAAPDIATRCDSCTAAIRFYEECWSIPTNRDFMRVVCGPCYVLGLR